MFWIVLARVPLTAPSSTMLHAQHLNAHEHTIAFTQAILCSPFSSWFMHLTFSVNKIFFLNKKKIFTDIKISLKENNKVTFVHCLKFCSTWISCYADAWQDEENINVNHFHFYVTDKSVAGLQCCQKWQTVDYSSAGWSLAKLLCYEWCFLVNGGL